MEPNLTTSRTIRGALRPRGDCPIGRRKEPLDKRASLRASGVELTKRKKETHPALGWVVAKALDCLLGFWMTWASTISSYLLKMVGTKVG